MKNKEYRSELEKESLRLINSTAKEQETLDCLYEFKEYKTSFMLSFVNARLDEDIFEKAE